MTNPKVATLHFDVPFDERTAFEAASRGYWGHSQVELANGTTWPVVFYDPVRLGQDLAVEATEGRPFIAERMMIVLQEVTKQNMEQAVEQLAREGFFQ